MLSWTDLETMEKPEIRRVLIDLLRYENKVRLSARVRENLGQIGEDDEAFDDYMQDLQEQVCVDCGVDPSIGVDLLQSASSLFPGDQQVLESANYLRYNRLRAGTLQVGDALPACEVIDPKTRDLTNLHELVPARGRAVVVGASYT
jgi:hypothetical protein